MSKGQTANIRKNAEKMEKTYKDKPVSWWAGKLAEARYELNWRRRDSYTAPDRTYQDEIKLLQRANSTLANLLEKYGARLTSLRVTFVEEVCHYEGPEAPECYEIDCELCDLLGEETQVKVVHCFDYKVETGTLDVITADFNRAFFDRLVRVEDVTNPACPAILWVGKENED